ncbi:hypothetical protein BGZ61DRAFT_239226 [Ilyonectria robusta]|uniref:uncharacterized protein n=1 Tax=Ilyonectria robusta TaxID=1079257 RepID=UPI001E8DE9A2|nr:uncharacterized protein BGZ61DRAFT_239226 [Ilyonectria robusta]KAH8699906.1 hypothetical protein BGZ61DRAFT_239226 [Ilyonectria robusta]
MMHAHAVRLFPSTSGAQPILSSRAPVTAISSPSATHSICPCCESPESSSHSCRRCPASNPCPREWLRRSQPSFQPSFQCLRLPSPHPHLAQSRAIFHLPHNTATCEGTLQKRTEAKASLSICHDCFQLLHLPWWLLFLSRNPNILLSTPKLRKLYPNNP